MDLIQKFYSDVKKSKKYCVPFSLENFAGSIAELFVRNNRHVESLARSVSDWWLEKYVRPLSGTAEGLSDDVIEKLGSVYALLENDPQNVSNLGQEDYKELCALVNYEAEDLPLELL
ncbi:MAG: hypothetical protein J5780_05080, partial [Treponema sp.]|nr:hypothetical protein [Treponema sp.]